MAYEDLQPGSYEAKLVDWDLEKVEKLNQPKLVLIFEFDVLGKNYKMKFESFVFKKDGTISKKYLDTLKTCGFHGNRTTDLLDDPNALNCAQTYMIDCQKGNNGFWKIEWVNLPGGGFRDKVASKKELAGFDFSKCDGALLQAGFTGKQKPKNYAPGATNATEGDSEEFGF